MFLNPLMLAAVSGIVSPILIHLLVNRRVQRVKWAAMMFIQDALKKKRRQMTVEDLILLLLRCLIVALIALAMARPTMHSAVASMLGQSKVVVDIVIDNSASMSLSDGAISRFELSKKLAIEMLGALPRGSAAAVYVASDSTTPLIATPTTDLSLVRQMIEQAQRSDRATNLLPALTQVSKMLSSQSATRKELWVITDGQASAFSQMSEIRGLLDTQHDAIHTTFVFDGITESRNLSVSGLALADGQFPVTGQSLNFDVQVSNNGTARADSVPVNLYVDDTPATVRGQIVSIPPGESRSILLAVTLKDAGYHTITAQLSHDRMPADDQRTIALQAYQQLQVLLVTSEPDPDSRQNAVYFLKQALVPVPADQRDAFFIRTKTIQPGQLDAARLSDYQLIVLADVARISNDAIEPLGRYIRSGGGLIVFPGEKTDASFYNDQLALLLPGALGAPKGNAADTDSAFRTLQSGDYVHPIVRLWTDPSAGSLATARFFRSCPLTLAAGTADSPTAVVLKYSDGSTALAERRLGNGEVLMFASTGNTAWNDLPVRPSFLPLMFRCVASVVEPSQRRLNVNAGDAFTFETPAEYADKEAIISRPLPPEGKPNAKPDRDSRRVELRHGQSLITYADTGRAGGYHVAVTNDKPLDVAFAVQPDPRESNLTLLSKSQVDELAKSSAIVSYDPATQLGQLLQHDRVGRELWMPLGMFAFAFAIVETILGDWFSQPK